MNDFNKKLTDIGEIQSEINKLKDSILNSMTNKDKSDAALVKTVIYNITSSNE